MSYCTKRGYPDAFAAQEALSRLVQRWLDGTIQDPCVAQRAYKCPDCGSYHLTKQPARRFNPTDVHVVLPPKAKALLAQRLASGR